MRIECPICRGPHPKWECKKPAKEWLVDSPSPGMYAREGKSRENAVKPNPPASSATAARKARRAAPEQVERSQVTGSDVVSSRGRDLPVDTNPEVKPLFARCKGDGRTTTLAGDVGDKDRPKFNKNEYQCRYMREVYRPRLKAKKDAAK